MDIINKNIINYVYNKSEKILNLKRDCDLLYGFVASRYRYHLFGLNILQQGKLIEMSLFMSSLTSNSMMYEMNMYMCSNLGY